MSEVDLAADPDHYVEGELEDVLFVSVPHTASGRSCDQLANTLRVAYGDKKQVVVLTHNIELLKARKLPSAEASAIVRRVESPSLAEEFATKEALYQQISAIVAGWSPDVFVSKPDGEIKEWAIDFMQSLKRTVEGDTDDADSGH